MRRSGSLLRQVHQAISEAVKPGVTTMDLEELAAAKITDLGAKAAFKGVKNPGFPECPAVVCTSVNDEVIHGFPSTKRLLSEGDIIYVDCGLILDGYYSDSAVTYPVGKLSLDARKLLDVTKASLHQAIQEVQVGQTLGDIGAAVQEMCEGAGFGVVREFVGHGIGKHMHEDPQVPNYGKRGKGTKLKAGMVLAIEPMINAGAAGVKVLKDGWTAVTVDGSLSAHFEHTVAVTKDGPLVLTR